jgi:choline dehydrogenase
MDCDLVICGAGSAGGVIAARATENPRLRVLLIEAGPDYADLASTPDDLQDGHHNSVRDHDWGFVYQPAVHIRPDVPLPRGKVTGGSSSVNTAIALRGQAEDYDEWAAHGLPEWTWAKCLPAFIRLETDQDIHNELHGDAGPIPIRRYRDDELVPFQLASMRACAALGYPSCPDHNDPTTTGWGPHPMNKQGRLRVGVLLTYLAQARTRPNCTIRARTLVRRVVIRDGRVAGIEVETDGATETIDCHTVVLSGGAIQSPGMLVRSGIGPREVLDRLGVSVVRDMPGVGARLLDHPASSVALLPKPGICDFDQPLIQTTLRYTAAGSDKFNDMQLEPLSFVQRGVAGPGEPHGQALFLGLAAVIEKPRGHGRLVFESADPHAYPVIQPDFLKDAWDLERLVEGLELALHLAETDEVRSVSEGIYRPRPDIAPDRAALCAWAQRACGSGYHPSGTTPMGPDGDRLAVVDQYGRVYGVEGLHVADAGIMPTIPRANTNIPTIMIGERFGEWFREGLLG